MMYDLNVMMYKFISIIWYYEFLTQLKNDLDLNHVWQND